MLLEVPVFAAMGKLVTALVNDFIMPVVSAVTPSGNWRSYTLDVGPVSFLIGDFIGALIDFMIVAFVVWRISKALIRPAPAAERPATRECPRWCRYRE